jgi:hypothetical protein
MNGLSLQNMNGVAGHVPVARPGVAGLGQSDVDWNLTPDWWMTEAVAPWWRRPALRPGETTRTRRTPEGGEERAVPTADRASWPLTPSNDERNVPSAFTGRPLRRLPKQTYPGSYPHGWIPYEDLTGRVDVEAAPMPSGWLPPQRLSEEEARAVQAGFPAPWAPPEAMAYDVSGFGDLAAAMGAARLSGLGVYVPPSVSTAIASEATAAAAQEAAKGSTWDTIAKVTSAVTDFGSSAAALYLQKREIDRQRLEEERRRAALAAQARGTLPQRAYEAVFAPDEPLYKRPLFIAGAGVGLLVIGLMAARALGDNPRRRRRR